MGDSGNPETCPLEGETPNLGENEVHPSQFPGKPQSSNSSGRSVLRVVSWNINGFRTIDMAKVLDQLNCSILAVQETKLTKTWFPERNQVVPPGYSSYFSYSSSRLGYSGVATFCCNEWTPIKAEEGLSKPNKLSMAEDAVGCYVSDLTVEEQKHVNKANEDGRTVITQHNVKLPDGCIRPLTIINVYCPRLRDDPEDPVYNNSEYKRAFHDLIQRRAKKLVEAGSFVLLIGDINIVHQMIDQSEITDPKRFVMNEFRLLLDDFVGGDSAGFVDTFRLRHPDQKSAFTCWCTRLNARENNYGARIDYIFADKELSKYLEKSEIHPDVMGSDHCPVSATFHSLQSVPHGSPPSFASIYSFKNHQTSLDKFLVDPNSKPKTISENTNRKRPFDSVSSASAKEKRSKIKLQTSLRNFLVKTKAAKSEPEPPVTCEVASNFSEVSGGSLSQEFSNERPTSKSSEAWKQLLKAPEIPLCPGHKEACVKRTVKKKGANFGRQFWSCSHGVGKVDDPNANCNFFKWVNQSNAK